MASLDGVELLYAYRLRGKVPVVRYSGPRGRASEFWTRMQINLLLLIVRKLEYAAAHRK